MDRFLFKILNPSLLLIFTLSLAAPTRAASPIKGSEHCVAYRAKKRLFMLKTEVLKGKNCDIAAQVIPEVGDKFSIEVFVPTDRFLSGDPEHDQIVSSRLKKVGSSQLVFRTAPFSKEKWAEWLKTEKFGLDGVLSLGSTNVPLSAEVFVSRVNNEFIFQGEMKTHFSRLGLKPPEMAFGFLSLVREELDLYFHFRGEKILGLGNLVLN